MYCSFSTECVEMVKHNQVTLIDDGPGRQMSSEVAASVSETCDADSVVKPEPGNYVTLAFSFHQE